MKSVLYAMKTSISRFFFYYKYSKSQLFPAALIGWIIFSQMLPTKNKWRRRKSQQKIPHNTIAKTHILRWIQSLGVEATTSSSLDWQKVKRCVTIASLCSLCTFLLFFFNSNDFVVILLYTRLNAFFQFFFCLIVLKLTLMILDVHIYIFKSNSCQMARCV